MPRDGSSTVADDMTAADIEGRVLAALALLISPIERELARQRAKWGTQDHDLGLWSLILIEEVGEFAQAILQGTQAKQAEEGVQVMAVLTRMLEKTQRT